MGMDLRDNSRSVLVDGHRLPDCCNSHILLCFVFALLSHTSIAALEALVSVGA